ncbi:MAG: SDR family oxidoreductase [Candidatus Portnoybacteria bacterium]
MKILITGSSGFLGKNLYRRLKKQYGIVGVDKNKSGFTDYSIDLSDAKETESVVKMVNPDVVIHTAALSNVDYCETHPKEAYNANVHTTENLINGLENKKAKFIFISSDYVYDGTEGNFDEESKPNPLNYYGKTKLEAERIVEIYENYLILRPTVMFGLDEGGKNFFMQLFQNQKEKKLMKVPVDQYSNPTYVNLLVGIIYESILKDLTGIFIATGPETINRYDFGLKISNVFDFDEKLMLPVRTEDLGQAARRPLNCGTCSDKIKKALKMEFPSLEESLTDLKSSIHTKR